MTCPVCSWRYGHAPECPLRKDTALELVAWWGSIGIACEVLLAVMAGMS